MGRLEKFGVLVIVVLLGVIIAVGFLKDPDSGTKIAKNTQAPKSGDVAAADASRGPARPVHSETPREQPKLQANNPKLRVETPAEPAHGTREAEPGAASRPAGNPPGGGERSTGPGRSEVAGMPLGSEKKTAEVASRKHVVKNGETLVKISTLYYKTPGKVKDILAANPSVQPTHMKPGTELVIPNVPAETASKEGTSKDGAPAGSHGLLSRSVPKAGKASEKDKGAVAKSKPSSDRPAWIPAPEPEATPKLAHASVIEKARPHVSKEKKPATSPASDSER